MTQYADILAFDKFGQTALIVEATIKRGGSSTNWAAKLRRNILAHDLLPNAPFFLLALPDNFYLSDNSNTDSEMAEPIETVNPRPFLQPYYESFGVSPDGLTARSFEFIVQSWLERVLAAEKPQNLIGNNQDWLINSGLFDKLAGGRLQLARTAVQW